MERNPYSPFNNLLTSLPDNLDNQLLVREMLYGALEIVMYDDERGGLIFTDNPFFGAGSIEPPKIDTMGRAVPR